MPSPDLMGRRVEVAPEGKRGVVIAQEPCEFCTQAGRKIKCGFDDVIVKLDDGTEERHYEPEVIVQ